jgi:hypothetical protein
MTRPWECFSSLFVIATQLSENILVSRVLGYDLVLSEETVCRANYQRCLVSTRYKSIAEDQLRSLQINPLCAERKCRKKTGFVVSERYESRAKDQFYLSVGTGERIPLFFCRA